MKLILTIQPYLVIVGLILFIPPATALDDAASGICIEDLRGLRGFFRKLSGKGPKIILPGGTSVQEIRKWLTLEHRVVITHPDGKTSSFARTDRILPYMYEDDIIPNGRLDAETLRGQEVVDFGCGGGSVVEHLRKNGVSIFGFDIFLNKRQRKKPYFVLGDALASPFESNRFDLSFSIWSVFTYNAYEAVKGDKSARDVAGKVLGEMIRVTRPNGTILLSPVPYKILSDGSIDLTEINSYLALHPNVRIKDHATAAWLKRTHTVRTTGNTAELNVTSNAEFWVELEKVE